MSSPNKKDHSHILECSMDDDIHPSFHALILQVSCASHLLHTVISCPCITCHQNHAKVKSDWRHGGNTHTLRKDHKLYKVNSFVREGLHFVRYVRNIKKNSSTQKQSTNCTNCKVFLRAGNHFVLYRHILFFQIIVGLEVCHTLRSSVHETSSRIRLYPTGSRETKFC